jgi:hypothetical protein
MALSAGARLGSYEVLGPIGAGGMGEVYRARDTRLGREVAIKVLPADRLADQARRARFEQVGFGDNGPARAGASDARPLARGGVGGSAGAGDRGPAVLALATA